MKTIKIFVSLLSAIFVLGSFAQSLRDIPQQGVSSESDSYITDDDALKAIAAVYEEWKITETGMFDWSTMYGNGFMVRNYLSDDLASGGSRSDQPAWQEFNESTITASNPIVTKYYEHLYALIYKANLVISKFDEKESDIKKRAIAEAYFFRAYAHYQLVNLWGTPPIVDHCLTPSEYECENSTTEALYAQIEKDYKAAIDANILPSKSGINDPLGPIRVTKEAAQAFYGQALLQQKKYTEAKSQFDKVIKSNLYELESDISKFFHTAGNNSKEYILEANRHYDTNNMAGNVQHGMYAILWNWAFGYGLFPGPDASKYFKFNAIGYSNGNVTKNLYDAFVAEEGKEGYRLVNNIKTWDQVVAMNVYTNTNMSFYMNEGLFRFKWLPSVDDENVQYWTGSLATTPLMRYADVLLMMAECCVMTDGGGDTYLNEVRTRAKLPTKKGITLEDVKTERRLELALEGIRYFDLLRWGDAPKALADKGKKLATLRIKPLQEVDGTDIQGIYNAKYELNVEYIDNEKSLAGFTVGRDELLPFPESELQVNKKLRQNPGYSN